MTLSYPDAVPCTPVPDIEAYDQEVKLESLVTS